MEYMEYITNIYVWMLTFVILEIVFYAVYFIWAKIDHKFIYKTKLHVIINAVESAILIVAVLCAGAPTWFAICILALSAMILTIRCC